MSVAGQARCPRVARNCIGLQVRAILEPVGHPGEGVQGQLDGAICILEGRSALVRRKSESFSETPLHRWCIWIVFSGEHGRAKETALGDLELEASVAGGL